MKAPSLERLVDEIRMIYDADPSRGESEIESFLGKALEALPPQQRLQRLEEVAGVFAGPQAHKGPGGEDDVLSRAVSLLLGKKISQVDLSSTELLNRLAESLNTIFDALNQLVFVINATLAGHGEGEETIRHVIGGHLRGEGEAKSLEAYLGQIKEAFLTAQEAFKIAAFNKVGQMLKELDPAGISEAVGKSFKFGPMRKAECFDLFEERYGKIKKWVESGRFMEEFLREFERNARKRSF